MTLEEYRLENNLSYKKLAEKLGFKEATVGQAMVFTKKSQPGIDTESKKSKLDFRSNNGSGYAK